MTEVELFDTTPWAFRLPVPEAVRLFREHYWRHRASASTTRKHLDRLATFFRHHHLDNVSKADVEAFRRSYRDMGLSETTANKGHMILTRMFNIFWEWKEAGNVHGLDFSRLQLPPRDKNPGKLVPKVNERPFARRVALSKDKVQRLAAWATQVGDHDLVDIIWGLYWFRLRQSDFFRLTSINVDLQHGILEGVQHKTITSKLPGGVAYRVVMGEGGRELIERRLAQVRPGSALFGRSNLQKRWTTVRRWAGLEYATLQDLRRSAATFLLDNGIDSRTVAESLGHTTERNLPSYTPRTLRHHRDATKILEASVEEK